MATRSQPYRAWALQYGSSRWSYVRRRHDSGVSASTASRTTVPVTVVYDDRCRVCRVAMALILVWDRAGAVQPVGFSAAESVGAPVGRDSWHLRDDAGTWHSAGTAIGPLVRRLPGGRIPSRMLVRCPRLVERLYRFVAGRRSAIGRHIPDRLVSWADREIARPGR